MPEPDPRSDEELVDAANAGDLAAFEALYRRYRDWVVAAAHRLSGSREDALDIAQDVFTWLLRRFPGFELRAQMKTVLYPAIRHAAIARGRRRRTRREHHPHVESHFQSRAGESASPGGDPTPAASESAELRDALARVLDSLSDVHREIVILRYVDGLALDDIARALDIPHGTARSRLHLALRALRGHEITKNYFRE